MNRETKINIAGVAGLAVSVFAASAAAQSVQVIFTEDFEGAVLEDSVDESTGNVTMPYMNVWTDTPPAGWTIDNTGTPGLGDADGVGVTEWEGWSFATIDFWDAASGQGRGDFGAVASGTVAIADGDEWDDLGSPGSLGDLTTLLSTPSLAVSGGETVTIDFASSWSPEDFQTAVITASFDVGGDVQVLRWSSQDDGDLKEENLAEDVSVDVGVPAGASSVTITFDYVGNNDWWWAIDNVAIAGSSSGALLSEDFEGLALEDSVDELIGAPDPMVWTDELAGWTFDDSGIPQDTLDDPAIGVEEWEGWSIANGPWWTDVAGDQNRTDFTTDPGALSTGNCLIADPDEWDDKGGAASAQGQGNEFNASVFSPMIDVSGLAAGTGVLNFYSSWRPEDDQEVFIAVSYDGGPFNDIMRWNSNGADTPVDPNGSGNQFGFKPDATNEVNSITLGNPAAATMQIQISMPVGDNDWWWALDDIYVAGETASAADNAPAPFFIDLPSHSEDLNPTLTFGIGVEGVSPDQVVPGAADFDIMVAKDAGFTDVRYTTNIAAGEFTFPEGALQSGVYFVKVIANNAAGSRESRNTVQFAVSNPCTNADINGDGVLDLSDITGFTTGFTTPCN